MINKDQIKIQTETSEGVHKLLNNINYGVILAYLDKFLSYLSIKEFNFDYFESDLINSNSGKNYSVSKLLLFFYKSKSNV